MCKNLIALGILLALLGACSFDSSGLKKPPGPACGNGELEEGETCDDSGVEPGDGCSAVCTVESGWHCDELTLLCQPVCGDGQVVGTETCDDSGVEPGDGCDQDCSVENGWHCEDEPSSCWTICGDGIRAEDELCDDGNLTPADGCDIDCTVEEGFSCQGNEPSICTAECGDNLVVGDELCDGVNLNGESCQTQGFYEGTISCMSDCVHLDLANCGRFCGDGVIDGSFGEECEGADFGELSCLKLGYPGGDLGCNDTCQADVTSCETWIQVALGYEHACALRSDHTLWCWGANGDGQLGQGATSTQQQTMVEVTALGDTVTAITLGEYHTCAVKTDGSVWCWGRNWNGQLGNDTNTSSSTPVQVKIDADRTLDGVTAVTANEAHSCALTTAGAVYCWGSNWQGRLGDGTYIDRRVATQATGMAAGVAKVTAGKGHTCVLKSNGQVWCWGRNWSGQVGDGTTTERTSGVQITWPTQPAPLITDIVCGEEFTCVITAAGGAWCFGENGYGQLGDDTITDHGTPAPVTGMETGIADVEAGAQHTCLIKTDGSLWCWGNNYYGRVGDGTATERHLPVAVMNMDDEVTGAGGGRPSTCGIRAGLLYCWGYNYYGQLGDGTNTDRYVPTPVAVP